jgi:hypothetical protein
MIEIEPDSPLGKRVTQLFLCAREIIRSRGKATRHLESKVGPITIRVSRRPPQKAKSDAATGRKWRQFRLHIRQQPEEVVLSVNYNDLDEIEITAFRQGVWENRVRLVGMGSEQWPVRTNRNSPANEALVETHRASPPT